MPSHQDLHNLPFFFYFVITLFFAFDFLSTRPSLIEKMDTSSFTNGRLQKLRGERVNSDKFQLHIIIQDSLLVSYQIFKKRPEDVGFVHDSRSKMPLRQSTDVRQPFSAAFHQNQYIKCANCYF